MIKSPLYYRYSDTVQGKAFSGLGNNFIRALASEIESQKSYEYLRGNKELDTIFEEYLIIGNNFLTVLRKIHIEFYIFLRIMKVRRGGQTCGNIHL